MILWLDKGTFLIRKLERWDDLGNAKTETVTIYHPKADSPIDLGAFD
jgi:hypothetical protein